jgi:hypothetical protein
VRRLALACLATIAAADYVIHRKDPGWFAIGPMDHAAHLATAALLLPRGRPAAWRVSFMAGSLLPDIDHVPLAFQDPEVGDPRPRTHHLIALGPALLGSRSTAGGMATHYARDLALEPGVPFLGGRHLRIPYAGYALLVLAAAYWNACGRPRCSS